MLVITACFIGIVIGTTIGYYHYKAFAVVAQNSTNNTELAIHILKGDNGIALARLQVLNTDTDVKLMTPEDKKNFKIVCDYGKQLKGIGLLEFGLIYDINCYLDVIKTGGK